MIIDAHNHPDWHGHDVNKFLQNMAQNGIDKSWLLTWECPVDEYDPIYASSSLTDALGPISLAKSLRYKDRAPDAFVLGYAPDPRRPEAIDRLQAAIEIYGVQVYGELKLRMMYDNLDALRVFRFCGEKGLPVTVHIDYEFDTGSRHPRPSWWYGGGIEAFERAVKACPGTTFIGHAPGFWAHISGDDQFNRTVYPRGRVASGGKVVELLRQCSNLHADLSARSALNALDRDRKFAKEFIQEFKNRLLFARDCFDDKLQEFLNSLGLPDDVLRALCAGNARRLLSHG